MLLGYIIYKFIPYTAALSTEIYNNYLCLNKTSLNELNIGLADNKANNIFKYLKRPISDKVEGLANFNQE